MISGQDDDRDGVVRSTPLSHQSEEALALLQATLAASPDGLYIVGRNDRVLCHNQPFLQMWNMPSDLMAPGADLGAQIQYLANQTIDPPGFQQRVLDLLEQRPAQAQCDQIILKDGRVFERHFQPQPPSDRIVGQIWRYRDITQQRRTTAALRQSQETFRRMVEQVSDLVVVVDAEGQCVYTSPNLSKILGYTAAELRGQSFSTLIHPADLALCKAVFRQVLASGQDLDEIEFRTRTKGGSWLWQSASLARSHDDAGNPLVLSVARTIEERKQREQTLQLLVEGTASQTGESFFQSCVRHMASLLEVDAVLIGERISGELPLIEIRSLIIAGQLQETFAYDPVDTPCHQTLQGELTYFAEALSASFPHYPLLAQHHFEGYLGVPLVDSSGIVIGLIATLTHGPLEFDSDRELFLNIFASRIVAELERQQTEMALRERERKYRAIFENSQVGIGRTAIQDGLILEANQHFADIMGYDSPQALIGRVSALTFYVHPGDRDRVLCQLQQEGIQDFELELQRRDGSHLWVLLSLRLNPAEACLEFVITDICERKQAEEALRQSQQFLHTIVESLPLTVFSKNIRQDFRYELINQGCEAVLGFTREAGLGKNDHELLPRAQADSHRQEDLEVLALRRPIEKTQELMRPQTGETTCIRSVKLPLFDSEGNPTHILAFGEDVTDAKRQEEALRTSEERFRTLIENVPGAVYQCLNDDRWTMTFLSDGIAALTGYSAAEFVHQRTQSLAALLPPDHFDRVHSVIQQAVETHQPYEVEYPITHANGSERWLYEKGRGIFDPQGTLQHLYGVIIDITDRKHTEGLLSSQKQVLELVAADAPLEETLTRLVNTFEELAQCRAGSFLFLESTTQQLHHGIAPNLPAAYCREINGLEIGPTGGSCGYAASTKAPVIVTDTFTDPLWQSCRHLAQTYHLRSCWSMPVLSFQGEVLGTFALYFDRPRAPTASHWQILETAAHLAGIAIERKRTAEERFRAKEAAEVANRAKSQFLANMSHELRTPMNAILGFAQLMARDADIAPQHQRALEVINRSGAHLLDLINDVLQMSKIEAGTVSLNRRPYDLHTLLQTLENLFRSQAENKGLTLLFSWADTVPRYVMGDEGKLRQILVNLLGNAIKFTSTGQVSLTVQPAINPESPAPNRVQFVVEDTGSGISDEVMPLLFQPFVQAFNHVPGEGGSGLGLAITQQFTQMMAGTVEVSTTVGQGSVFTVTLPLELANPEAVTLVSADKAPQSLAPNQLPYRILVVDNRPESREPLRQLLQSAGFETRVAVNGEEALAQWQTWRPHLIWMDMGLPSPDSYLVTRRIRELEQTLGIEPTGKRTPIIALTANALEDSQAEILAAGCDDFIDKPFHTEEIFRTIADHLGVQYESSALATGLPLRDAGVDAVSPNALQVMPDGWLQAFQQAAIQADADWLRSLVEQVPDNQVGLMQALNHLITQLDFETLIDLTETALGE